MPSQLTPAVGSNDHIQGTDAAAVEIVEFGDFQCPDCGDAYPVIKEIQQTFGDQIRFVFRNFPLEDIHPNARIAAMAAEAAGLQGKYWEMNDLIFETQPKLTERHLHHLAEQIGLDSERFKKDLINKSLQQKVDADVASAMDSDVQGTPTFFVNGKQFDGGADNLLEVLKESAG